MNHPSKQRAATWLSLHIFLPGAFESFLVDHLAPALQNDLKAGTIKRFFFIRYSEGGDHIRSASQTTPRRAYMWQESSFLRTLYGDERFLALVQYESNFLAPRVLTNLLYRLVSMVGLNVIDKMSLCYHSHRIVEDHFHCDITEILKENVERLVSKHAHHLAQH